VAVAAAEEAVPDAPSPAPEPLDAAAAAAVGAAEPGAPLRVPAAADGKQAAVALPAVVVVLDAPWSAPVPARRCCAAAAAVVATALPCLAAADR
jgi:hypothetical protein